MERILVLSDSHGNVDNMIEAVNNTEPDRIIHLGDCFADARKLHKKFPEIPMAQVPGNCVGMMARRSRFLRSRG